MPSPAPVWLRAARWCRKAWGQGHGAWGIAFRAPVQGSEVQDKYLHRDQTSAVIIAARWLRRRKTHTLCIVDQKRTDGITMIVATAQPYFAPHPGFLYRAHQADVLVLLDTVQFPRGTTWMSRNRFKNDQGTLWLTVPVWKKGLGLQAINQVRICHEFGWAPKHLRSLKSAYARAPYLADHLPFIEEAYSRQPALLFDLNQAFMAYLLQQFGIETRVKLLSRLGLEQKGTQLAVEICRSLGATGFLAQKAAEKYLDKAQFRRKGIELRFMRSPACIYPQLWGPFIRNLSSFDLLFNCGPKSRDILLA